MEDTEQQLKLIESLFLKMGAPEERVQIMASQLLKRARQIADEHGITLVESVEGLLKQVLDAQNR